MAVRLLSANLTMRRVMLRLAGDWRRRAELHGAQMQRGLAGLKMRQCASPLPAACSAAESNADDFPRVRRVFVAAREGDMWQQRSVVGCDNRSHRQRRLAEIAKVPLCHVVIKTRVRTLCISYNK
jgi:hypothetical protein